MKVETLDDWNAAVADGACLGPPVCAMPACPVPTIEIETFNLNLCGYKMSGHPDPIEADVLWGQVSRDEHGVNDPETDFRQTYDVITTSTPEPAAQEDCSEGRIVGSASEESTSWTNDDRDAPVSVSSTTLTLDGLTDGTGSVEGPEVVTSTNYTVDPPDTTTDTGTNSLPYPDNSSLASDQDWSGASLALSGTNAAYDVTGSIDYSGPFDRETAVAAIIASADPASPTRTPGTGNVLSSIQVAIVNDGEDEETRVSAASGKRGRWRYAVPDDHAGSYFKFTADVWFYPLGWDATIPNPEDPEGPEIPDPEAPAPSEVSADMTATWSGPGTGTGSDPSWRTAWVDAPAIPGEGELRLVNLRFECRRTPWGWKPQTTGEASPPPPPEP